MRTLICLLLLAFPALGSLAENSWQAVLATMPLSPGTTQLSRSNCVAVMLRAFQSNDTVKALIFMPGATDEFYFFRRATAALTNQSPTLLDAVLALTNQTLIRVTFRSPMLLLHTVEDPTEPLFQIEDWNAEERLHKAHFVPHALYDDRDWNFLLPILSKRMKTRILPYRNTRDSWHFFRHSFAAWNLTGWEALEAVSLAGKTTFTVQKRRVIFEGETRPPPSQKP